ncbi:hypothetical protein R5R35_000034 [Gryllus longicercus]|uniref:GYF domain-containing protein n=1 Tax=Gryllus longicercus TaxID=2509291 RepID=A0AAN9VN46_9ORTH
MSEEELNSYEADWNAASTIKSGLKKHTLDSDEEDDGEEKKYEIMEDDDIEGQEDGAGGFDGEVTITPFNMKEEMEEGHFDTDGNYHWKKEGKMIRDNWLENIDWVEIKKQENPPEQVETSDSEDSTPFDQIPTYRKMLTLMKPGESVTRALRRLGGTKTMSASERWRRKKAGLLENSDENRQQVIDLTELANTLLTETGNMDIYEETFEHITSLVAAADKKHAVAHPKPKSYDDALDMYADDFDEKEKARLSENEKLINAGESLAGSDNVSKTEEVRKHKLEERDGERPNKRPKVQFQEKVKVVTISGNNDAEKLLEKKEESEEQDLPKSDEVYWEFKWKEDSPEVDGPHSSSQMHTWVEEGRFKEPVWVRKVKQNGPFYSSARVDFELYF